VIRAAVVSTSHPQPRRVLALAALQAGESRATLRKWLRQEDENDHANAVSPQPCLAKRSTQILRTNARSGHWGSCILAHQATNGLVADVCQ
jgi:hypothetical protein